MKIISLNIIYFLAISFQLIAQYNYVPNYSFEKYDTCPDGFSYLTPSCDDWFNPISRMSPPPSNIYSPNNWGSSDYYNSCSSNPQSTIPNNFVGNQYPKSGKAYSGFLLIYNDTFISTKTKEYIEIKTIKKLTKDTEYCIEFYYSIAEFNSNSNYLPVMISVLLTDTVVFRINDALINKPKDIITSAQINQTLPYIKDTTNWIRVIGSYIAEGGEEYITIGNFQKTNMLQNRDIYVYVDDVKLYYCGPDTTPQPTDSMVIPNIFTPNGDGYNDIFEYENQEQWEFETQIFSRWGNLVFDNNNSENWDGRIDGELVTSGVYFYVIKAVGIRGGEIRIYKGTVTIMY